MSNRPDDADVFATIKHAGWQLDNTLDSSGVEGVHDDVLRMIPKETRELLGRVAAQDECETTETAVEYGFLLGVAFGHRMAIQHQTRLLDFRTAISNHRYLRDITSWGTHFDFQDSALRVLDVDDNGQKRPSVNLRRVFQNRYNDESTIYKATRKAMSPNIFGALDIVDTAKDFAEDVMAYFACNAVALYQSRVLLDEGRGSDRVRVELYDLQRTLVVGPDLLSAIAEREQNAIEQIKTEDPKSNDE